MSGGVALWRYEAAGTWSYVTRDPAAIKRPGERLWAYLSAEADALEAVAIAAEGYRMAQRNTDRLSEDSSFAQIYEARIILDRALSNLHRARIEP